MHNYFRIRYIPLSRHKLSVFNLQKNVSGENQSLNSSISNSGDFLPLRMEIYNLWMFSHLSIPVTFYLSMRTLSSGKREQIKSTPTIFHEKYRMKSIALEVSYISQITGNISQLSGSFDKCACLCHKYLL